MDKEDKEEKEVETEDEEEDEEEECHPDLMSSNTSWKGRERGGGG